MTDKSNMENWFPTLESMQKYLLPVKIPKTAGMTITQDLFYRICRMEMTKDELAGIAGYINHTRAQAGIDIPFFLRTGLSSNKHEWIHTCYVTTSDPDKLIGYIYRMFEGDLLKMCVIMSPFLFIREFIPMNYSFKAFDEMPISREFRLFSDDGVLTHIQPYWIPDSIRNADKEDWKELLKEQHQITKEEKQLLVRTASRVTRKLKGHWSVDFCQAVTGEWYLIDMAEADKSFKWEPDGFDWNFITHEEYMKQEFELYRDLIEENKEN